MNFGRTQNRETTVSTDFRFPPFIFYFFITINRIIVYPTEFFSVLIVDLSTYLAVMGNKPMKPENFDTVIPSKSRKTLKRQWSLDNDRFK